MATSREIWIILPDDHERSRADGAWASSLGPLRAAVPHPLVLTNLRLRPCIEAVAPAAPCLTAEEGELAERLGRLDAGASGWVELVGLTACNPGTAQRIRSFGLRAAVLGRVLSRRLAAPLHALLWSAAECPDPGTGRGSPPPGVGLRTVHRFRRHLLLEAWVLSGAEEVASLGLAGARRLEARHLLEPGTVTPWAATGWEAGPAARAAAEDLLQIAVLPPVSSLREEVRVLAALRRARRRRRFELVWLGPRRRRGARRAAALRRHRLASCLRWEEEPWRDPPPLTPRRWDLLIVADPALEGGPLVRACGAAGVPLITTAQGGGEDPDRLAARIQEALDPQAGKASRRRDQAGELSMAPSAWSGVRVGDARRPGVRPETGSRAVVGS